MSVTSVDLPAPDTPVIAVNTPAGKSTVRFRRLCCRAPTTRITLDGSAVRRLDGTLIRSSRRRYRAVSESRCRSTASSGPATTTSPPWRPPRGPQVHGWVRRAVGFFFVLAHEDRGAQIAEFPERVEQAGVVS